MTGLLETGVVQNLLSSVTSTGASTVVVCDSSRRDLTVQVSGSGTITGGTINIEENITSPTYAGTWSLIQGISGTSISGTVAVCVHITALTGFIRANVTSAITGGGSISVDVIQGGR